MRKWMIAGFLVAGSTMGAWLGRESLVGLWHGYVQPPTPAQTPIYGWQDQNADWHFSSTRDDKKAQLIMIDTGKITPIKPPPLAPPKVEANQLPNPLDIKGIREDMIRQQQLIQAAKERQILDEGR